MPTCSRSLGGNYEIERIFERIAPAVYCFRRPHGGSIRTGAILPQNRIAAYTCQRISGDHNLFICGNDPAAKKEVAKYLNDWFGWKLENILDVGEITTARGTEMMMPLWMRLFQGVIGHPHFNYQIVRGT